LISHWLKALWELADSATCHAAMSYIQPQRRLTGVQVWPQHSSIAHRLHLTAGTTLEKFHA
jgi:hypothetical protein